MKLDRFIDKEENRIDAHCSIKSIEDLLIEKKYLTVMKESEYYGLLSLQDFAETRHNLVIDCVREKPPLRYETDDMESILDLMIKSGQRVLPVLDRFQGYRGAVTLENIIRQISVIFHTEPTVEVKNYIGEKNDEEAKSRFLAEICHNTRNPMQGILSAVNYLETGVESEDQRLFLTSIRKNIKLINQTINKMTALYMGTGYADKAEHSP